MAAEKKKGSVHAGAVKRRECVEGGSWTGSGSSAAPSSSSAVEGGALFPTASDACAAPPPAPREGAAERCRTSWAGGGDAVDVRGAA